MDMSDDENGAAEQPNKKARTGNKAVDGDSAPKWSNPDPYTALPPPDESLRKKKDVVKLIRKARVETNPGSSVKVDPADDFISFDFGDEEDAFKATQDRFDHYSPDRSGMGVEGAPTGPRFSHAANLHKQQAPVVPPPAPPAQKANQQIQARATNQTLQDRTNNQTVQARANKPNVQAQTNNENIRFAIPVPNVALALANMSSPSKPVRLDTNSDPSLGSRKRNFRDQIKPAPVLHQVGGGVSKKAASGVILKQWQAMADSTCTPWLEIDHSDTANMGLW